MDHKAAICAGIFLMHLTATTRTIDVLTQFNNTAPQHYHLINKSLTWHEAQSFCRIKYTDLATVNNMVDENQLVNTLGSHMTSSWIGLYKVQYRRWKWSDGRGSVAFTKWSYGEPNNAAGNEWCGEMFDDGTWNDVPCGVTKAYICYEQQQDGSQRYVYYSQGQSWENSQDVCRQKHTDLAYVETEVENSEIEAVTNRVWIGLFNDDWAWSDGTETSFRNWMRGISYSGKCVLVEGTQQGRWVPGQCDQKAPFICHGGLKVKKMVIRMMVHSDVDLADSTTTNTLLKKLETILKDQGVTDFKLSWQGDKYGRVFQRHEQLEKTEETDC